MEENNILSNKINSAYAEEHKKADAICKSLLANKQVLAHILKECAAEFKDCSVEDIAKNILRETL